MLKIVAVRQVEKMPVAGTTRVERDGEQKLPLPLVQVVDVREMTSEHEVELRCSRFELDRRLEMSDRLIRGAVDIEVVAEPVDLAKHELALRVRFWLGRAVLQHSLLGPFPEKVDFLPVFRGDPRRVSVSDRFEPVHRLAKRWRCCRRGGADERERQYRNDDDR